MAANSKFITWLQIALFIEIPILLIALLMPVTPSKTGSKGDLVESFVSNPTYLDEVIFYWIFTHLVLGVVAAIILILWKRSNNVSPQSSDSDAE